MVYKEFNVKVGKTLAAKITISEEDMSAAGFSCTGNVVKQFIKNNPEYTGCSHTSDIHKGVWTISLWTTSEVVFKEV